MRSLLIASTLIACSSSRSGTDLHVLPPAPEDCRLELGGSAIELEDSITVCVPGAYCPTGYNAGDIYRDYHASLRHPPEWTRLDESASNVVTLIRSGFASAPFLRIGVHEIRLDNADALQRLEDASTAWPDTVREQIEIDGRAAVHFAYTYDRPRPGLTVPAPGEMTALNLAIADGVVVAQFSGNALTNSTPEVFCEIESILASVRF